jgi:predicted Zn-dependent protease
MARGGLYSIGRALAIACAAALLVACETVPITGRTQLILLSPAQEARMGLDAFRQILAKEKLSTDPELNAMLQRVGQRIAAATGRTDFQWEFRLIDNDKMINAFALPGGKVAVYTGILPLTRDEAGLAAVVGHEVAHATARHGAERVSHNLVAQIGIAATAAAIGGRDTATSNLAIAALGAGAAIGVLLPFSRLQETEADQMGMIYMARAGYHPGAARDLWVRMAEAAAKRGARPPEWLSTHPADQTRIRDIEAFLPKAMAEFRPR